MKKWVQILVWTAVLSGALVLLSFVHSSNENKTCWKVDIDISNSEKVLFVNESLIRQQISEEMGTLEETSMSSISIDRIRDIVLKNSGVSSAIVHKTIDGRIHIDAEQRVPNCRVLNADGSGFYLDREGWIIPLSNRYTAHVPVFTGALNESIQVSCIKEVISLNQLDKTRLDEIHKVANFLNEHSFWLAQIDHVWVEKDGDFIMIPRIGQHEIIVGNVDDLEVKMKKLEAFYQQTVNKANLNKYETINLKFRDQVVCKRKAWH
ncbi:MAG: cell division protein FtsQ [Flavobacteriales bacterium]|jgi:cell division protein FtsQ